jgi:hypothetical protein
MFLTVPWGVNFSTRGDSWARRSRLRLRKKRKKETRAREAFFILSPYGKGWVSSKRQYSISKFLEEYPAGIHRWREGMK